MKLLSLDLIAYGNFTDRRLRFPEEKGLFLIHGPNEAGKSTCLRALRGLLYGIPETTSDDFIHEGKRLRIGGLLLRSDGERLSVVRRKGRKDTLLGPDGRPMPDEALRSFLAGVDRETFTRVFGMSREELVSGGRAIMEGKGGVGETLFAAGLGGANLKHLIEALDREAGELFKPGGSAPRLNSEAKAYRELKSKIREVSLLPKDWEEVDGRASSLKGQSAQLKEKTARLSAEKDRLKRIGDALPVLAELRECREARLALGEIKVLREGFARERSGSQEKAARAAADEGAALERIGELEAELGKLSVPEDLLAQEKTVSGLVEELGSILKAQRDLPRVQGQVLEETQAAREILGELRPDLPLESAGALRLTRERIERIRGLAEEHGRLTVRLKAAAERLSEHALKLSAARRSLEILPGGRDVSDLEPAIVAARKRGDLERLHGEATFEAGLARKDAETALKRLPLWGGTLEDLESLPLPPENTVHEFEAALDALDEGLRRKEEALAETKRKTAEIDGNLRTLRLTGEPPTEEDLVRARARRGQGWDLVRAAWLEGRREESAEAAFDPVLPLDQAYERSVSDADGVADRMRREAEGVARKAALLADRGLQQESGESISGEIEGLREKRRQMEGEWVSRWAPAGIAPLSPREMRAWTADWRDLARRMGEIRKLESQAQKIAAEAEGSRKSLLDRLASLGEALPPAGSSLEAILLRCEEVVLSVKDLKIRRQGLEREIEEAVRGRAKAEEEERKGREALARWEREWAAAVQGLSGGLSAATAISFLDRCSALWKKLEDAEKDKGRIEGMKRDIKEFEKKVEGFAARYAPDLGGSALDQAVRELASRVSRAKADAASRAGLSAERAARKKELEKARETTRQTAEHLSALRREAGCRGNDDLPDAEARSEKARSLDGKTAELTRQLLKLSGGRNVEDFGAEAGQWEPERVGQRLASLEADLDEAQEELGRISEDLGAANERLRSMDGRADAAWAAQQAQETLVSLRGNLDRYLQARLAAKILRAEIERYRASSQGPVLRRAAELFALVTRGRFVDLEPDYGAADEPVLVGVRAGGEKVDLAGMSDGTQDQLYLVLRLASLEKFIAGGEPLPLLVDDALVNFDNDRGRAALKVFGGLAALTQVIFFTHHRHMVDLAREAVDDGVLHIQELGS